MSGHVSIPLSNFCEFVLDQMTLCKGCRSIPTHFLVKAKTAEEALSWPRKKLFKKGTTSCTNNICKELAVERLKLR